jgi:hypothetical protein
VACLVPLASTTVAVAESDGEPEPVKSSTFQSAGYLKDTWPFGKVYVLTSAAAGAGDGEVPGVAAPPAPAPPPAEADGLAEADAVADAAGEDDDGAADTMAPQPAKERAAAARAVTTGTRNAGRMVVPFMMTPSSSQGAALAHRVGMP